MCFKDFIRFYHECLSVDIFVLNFTAPTVFLGFYLVISMHYSLFVRFRFRIIPFRSSNPAKLTLCIKVTHCPLWWKHSETKLRKELKSDQKKTLHQCFKLGLNKKWKRDLERAFLGILEETWNPDHPFLSFPFAVNEIIRNDLSSISVHSHA